MLMNPVLKKIHEELGIGERHLSSCKLAWCEQPRLDELEVVDIDFDGRPFILTKAATQAWREMRKIANSEKVVLEPYSGFRSYLHQRLLIKKKLELGRSLEVILTETAIPGFSEHHSGRAVDIWTENKCTLDESFEKTLAFAWLSNNAHRFMFRLSYPRDNDKGIIYEPWHWYFSG
jgi:zinc D-Ala-D-Ala carboxypeptidase